MRKVIQDVIDRAQELSDRPMDVLRSLASDSESSRGGAPGKNTLRLEFRGVSRGKIIGHILEEEFASELEVERVVVDAANDENECGAKGLDAQP